MADECQAEEMEGPTITVQKIKGGGWRAEVAGRVVVRPDIYSAVGCAAVDFVIPRMASCSDDDAKVIREMGPGPVVGAGADEFYRTYYAEADTIVTAEMMNAMARGDERVGTLVRRETPEETALRHSTDPYIQIGDRLRAERLKMIFAAGHDIPAGTWTCRKCGQTSERLMDKNEFYGRCDPDALKAGASLARAMRAG